MRVGSTLEEYNSGKHKSSILFGGYYGTQYRVRFYPPFGYVFFSKEYNLTGFDNQKYATHKSCVSPLVSDAHRPLAISDLARTYSSENSCVCVGIALNPKTIARAA